MSQANSMSDNKNKDNTVNAECQKVPAVDVWVKVEKRKKGTGDKRPKRRQEAGGCRRPEAKSGQWICISCKFSNYYGRLHCYICNESFWNRFQ